MKNTVFISYVVIVYSLTFAMYALNHGYFGGELGAYVHILLATIIVIVATGIRTERLILLLSWLSIPFILLLFLTYFQAPINGARRWIVFAGTSIQPSEFLKVFLPCLVHQYVSQRKGKYSLFLVGIPVVAIALQPDMGTATFVLGISFFVALNGKLVWLKIGLMLSLCIALLASLFQFLLPYQKLRILAWLSPESVSPENLYQSEESSLIFFQTGTFSFEQCHSSLFAINTDFIWTLYACVYGRTSIYVLLLSLVFFLFVCLWPIRHHLSNSSCRLAAGLLLANSSVWSYTLLMAMGLVPVIGFPTPLLSYGGSSFLTSALGLTLSIKILANQRNLTLKIRTAIK